MSGRCTRRLSDRRDRRDDRSGGGHERAADRRLASLHGPSQRSRRDQRKENSADRARRLRRAIESGGQRQAAAHSGQRESTSAFEPVLDIRAGHRRDQACQCGAHADGGGLSQRGLPAGRSATILHHRVRRRLRQPRDARLYQGDGKRAGAHRICRHAIPVSRGEIDYAEEQAKAMGMTPVDKEVIPPPTADYTPFATKLKDANPNWIFSWAPWVTQVKTFEALRRLGWEGDYITWAHIEAE